MASPMHAYYSCLGEAISYSSSSLYWRTGLGLILDSNIYRPQRNISFILASIVLKCHHAKTFEVHYVFSISS